MLSPNAMAEAARIAGWYSFTTRDETLWYGLAKPGLPLDHPLVLPAVASALRGMVVGSPDIETQPTFYYTAYKIDPRNVLIGAVFQADDALVCCAMVALKHWTVEYATAALRGTS